MFGGPWDSTLNMMGVPSLKLGVPSFYISFEFRKVVHPSVKAQCNCVVPRSVILRAMFGPQGGTLIFSHIRRLGPFFWVQNSKFQYFFGFSEK